MQRLAQGWVRLAEQAERSTEYQRAGYRAKAWECISRAENVRDGDRRADLLGFGRLWMSLAENETAGATGAGALAVGTIIRLAMGPYCAPAQLFVLNSYHFDVLYFSFT